MNNSYLETIKNKSIHDIRESILRTALSDLEGIYIPLTYRWIDAERPDLKSQLSKLEKKIDECNYSLFDEDAEYKTLIKSYVNFHKTAIHLYRKHLSNLDKNLNLIKDQNNLVSDRALCRGETHMSITNVVQKKKELPSAEVHIATIYQIIGLGTHYIEKYKKSQEEVYFTLELNENMTSGKPFVVSRKYNPSLWGNGKRKSQLRTDLEAARGKVFTEEELENGLNLKKFLGLTCLVTITHNKGDDGAIYANILSFSAIPKGMEVPKPMNDFKFFAIEEFDQKVFDELPEWMQTRIEESEEMTKKHKPAPTPDDGGDENGGYINGKSQNIETKGEDVPF